MTWIGFLGAGEGGREALLHASPGGRLRVDSRRPFLFHRQAAGDLRVGARHAEKLVAVPLAALSAHRAGLADAACLIQPAFGTEFDHGHHFPSPC